MSDLYSSLAAMVLLILLGAAAQSRLRLSQTFYQGANTLIIRVTLPAMILSSMDKPFSHEMLQKSAVLLLIAVGAFGTVMIGLEVWRHTSHLPVKTLGLYQYLILVGNTAFMGYPVIQALLGSDGIFYASVFNIAHNLVTFSYAIHLLQCDHTAQWRTLFNNICLLASIVGLILFISPMKLPSVIYQALDWVGQITIPLCLICMGANLSWTSFQRAIQSCSVWVISLTRLCVFPLLMIPILYLLHCRDVTLIIPSILFATPAALTAGAFAQQYGCDADFASNVVVLSNVLAMVTIPLIVMLLPV